MTGEGRYQDGLARGERVADEGEAMAFSRGCPECGLAVRAPDDCGYMRCTDPWCAGRWTARARDRTIREELEAADEAARDDADNGAVDRARDER